MPRNLPTKPQEEIVSPEVEAQVEAQEEEDLGITVPSFGVTKKHKAPIVHVEKYRVERGPGANGEWRIMTSGGSTHLMMGKIIDCRTYDLDKLRSMGVQLTKIES